VAEDKDKIFNVNPAPDGRFSRLDSIFS
jgi:hypothetical protein